MNMIYCDGSSKTEFGWLLADVPETKVFNVFENSSNNEFNITETVKEDSWNYKNPSNIFQLQCSKTPSPRKKRQFMNPLILANTWPSPRLSHTIESDDNEELDEPKFHFFKIATQLDNKIEDMSCQTIGMQNHTKTLKRAYEELENTTTQLLTEVRSMITELKNLRNLEELLSLLEGDTDGISLRKWPFLLANASPFHEMNLIV